MFGWEGYQNRTSVNEGEERGADFVHFVIT